MGEGLTTGWEADVGAGDSLLRGFVLSTADRSVVIADAGGGEVRRTDRAVFADGRSPVLFDNVVTLLRPMTADEARDVVREALAFYPPERPFVVLSVWPIPDAGDLGIELMGHPPFMFRPVAPPPDGWERGLELREVTDAEGLSTFFRTITEAYPMPADDSALAQEGVLGSGIRLWVGYEDGRPVGTAGTYVAHGTNDVEWVSVYPEHRGKGYGAALTWVATLADPTLPGVLIASDDGQPVYERMGYVRLTRLSLWFRPPGQ